MATKFSKQLGNRIRYFRNLNGFTQEVFSEKIGIEPTTLGHIETGKNLPSTSRLSLMAEVLNIEVYQFFVSKETDSDTDKIKAINKILKAMNKTQISLAYDLLFNLFDLSAK